MSKKKEKMESTGKENKEVKEKSKKLEDLVAAIKKNHGDGSVFFGNAPIKQVEVIPTGSMIMDAAAGVGGLPRGRIVEIFGPEASGKSSICLTIVAQAQKLGFNCAYIDTEHALDIAYARKLGVDDKKLLLSQPDYAEQALDIFKEVAESGAVDVIVLDSVAALVPKNELEGEMGDQSMGVQARMMSKALRVITGTLNKNNCMGIFINQIRMKIGVMYGCFHGETLVSFADGSQVPIKTVVENKLEGPVLSWNPKTKEVEEKKITNWFKNGKLDPSNGDFWMNFIVESSGGSGGRMGFSCTPNHSIFLPDGSTAPAITIEEGDEIVSWSEESISGNEIYKDLIFGSLLGDGRIKVRDSATGSFTLANQEQPEYLNWKLNKLKELGFRKIETTLDNKNKRVRYDSEYTSELAKMRNLFYKDTESYRLIPEMLKLTPLMAAVWFMDDGNLKETHRNGTISIKRLFSLNDTELSKSQINRAKSIVVDFIGCPESEVNVSDSTKTINISTKAFERFSHKIAPFVPECMNYKILPEHRGHYDDFNSGELVDKKVSHTVKVISIDTQSRKKMKSKSKYDLQIEDNSCYFVGGGNRGVAVHNSPETTTGGNALKFYASVRMRVSKGETIGSDPARGHMINVKFVKNKMAPPFTECAVPLLYGKGVDTVGDLFTIAKEWEVLDVRGAHSYFDGEKIASSRDEAIEKLRSDKELFSKIESAVRRQLKLKQEDGQTAPQGEAEHGEDGEEESD